MESTNQNTISTQLSWSAKYDTPGQDIRNVHELADPTRAVRIKSQYAGLTPVAVPPASQLDAFELH